MESREIRRQTLRKAFLALLFVQLFLKAALLLQYFQEDPFAAFQRADSAVYLEWAHEILAGHDYGARAYYQAPGYPALVSAVFFVLGETVESVLLLQLLAGSLTLFLIYHIGERLVSPMAGFIAALLTGLHAPIPFHELKLLPVSWILLGDAAVFWLALRALEKPEWLRFLLLGLAGGILVVLSPTRLLLALCALGGFLVFAKHIPVRQRGVLAAVFGAGLFAAIFPVSLRNRVAEGRWVLVSVNAPETFYQGNNRLARGGLTTPPELGTDIKSQAINRRVAAERELGRKLTHREIDRFWIRKSLSWFREDPPGFLRLMGSKLLMSFSSLDWFDIYSFRGERQYFLPLLGLFAVPFGLLALPGLAGFFASSGHRKAWMLFASMFATNHVVLLIFYSSTRYRLPSVPWLALMSAVVFVELLRPELPRVRKALALVLGVSLIAALALWDRQAKRTFPEEQFYMMAADAYVVEKRFSEAREWLEKARQAAPSRAVDSKLARVSFRAGDVTRANELLAGLAARGPLDLEEMELWAGVQWNLGQFEAAERTLLLLVSKRPDNLFLLKKLAACQIKLGKEERARETLFQILSLVPGDPEATVMMKSASREHSRQAP